MTETRAAETAVRRFLTFRVGGESCAVDLAHIREIVRFESATRVPRVPDCVRGVVNLRGNIVPVIDLAAGLGLAETRVTSLTCLLVVEMPVAGEASVFGVLAGAVDQVLELGPDDVEPPPPFGTPVPAAQLAGMARSKDGFVFLLDLDRLLGDGGLLQGTAAAPVAGRS
jgi:purine-binding chemotaxis protein CheW